MIDESQVERLVDDAVLGKQVDEFMSSDVGRFLATRIQQEYDAGVAELVKANPFEVDSVRTAQGRVHLAERMDEWLRDAIARGVQATQVLQHREFEDEPHTD